MDTSGSEMNLDGRRGNALDETYAVPAKAM